MPAKLLPPTEWIETAIRIDSVTDKSNAEMVRFLTPLLKESGLTVEEQRVVENGETFINLLASNRGTEHRDLLVLNTHLDTVSGGAAERWTKTDGDPFKATIVRDRVYGLGSADVKLDFLCKIVAARQAAGTERPFALVGTFGEERGLVGAAHLFKEKRVRPRFALVGEPSNLELIYAHKGHLFATAIIDLDVKNVAFIEATQEKAWKGKAAHSSTPDLGDNAIRKALLDIQKRGQGIVRLEGGTAFNVVAADCRAELLRRKTGGTARVFEVYRRLEAIAKELKKRRDPRFSPSVSTVSLNVARTIDGELHLTFDIRTLPDVDPDRLEAKVRALEKIPGVRIGSLTQDMPLKGKKNGKFLEMAAAHLKRCGVKAVCKTKASSTEAAIYNYHGAEAIVFGPGLSIGNVHRPNEYNSLRQMEIATRFYTAVLKTPPGEL